MIQPLFLDDRGNGSILRMFLVILGLLLGPVGSQMYGAAPLDVQEMGWNGKLGPGKN